MAFLNKLNNVAKNAAKTAADMANDAIGSGRIAVKIKKEELTIQQQYEKIGRYFYKQRKAGLDVPPEVEEFCVAIDIAFATIKELQEELDDLKDGSEISVEVDITIDDEQEKTSECVTEITEE